MGLLDLFRSKSLRESRDKKAEKAGDSGKAVGYAAPIERRKWNRSTDSIWGTKDERIKLKEQFGFPFDNPDANTKEDDRFYVRIGDVSPLDLPANRVHTAHRLSLLLWQRNPRAFRAIELVKDFVIGEGIRFHAADPKVEEVLRKHWVLNEWEDSLTEILRSLAIFGELLFRAEVREPDGMVILDSITPARIYGIRSDPDNANVLTHVVTTLSRGVPLDGQIVAGQPVGPDDMRAFRMIRPGADGRLSFDGEDDAFFFAVNRVDGGRRGMGDLLPSMDWLEGLDGFTFALLERADLASNVVFDIKYKGFNDKEIKDRIDQFNAQMRDGMTYGHNENTELTIKSPQLSGKGEEIIQGILLKHIQAGTGLAGLFFGSGEDLTRSSASELTMPAAKMIQARQQMLRRIIRRIFTFQIEQAENAGVLSGVKDFRFEIDMPRIFLRDLTTVTKSIFTLTEALVIGQDREWITKGQAAAIYKVSLEQLGSLPEPREEAKNATKEEKEEGRESLRETGGPADNGKDGARSGSGGRLAAQMADGHPGTGPAR